MAVRHVYSNAVADGTNTDVVRPADWNSYHNQYYTISGNTAGQSTFSGTNVVFQGGNNVTLSANTNSNGITMVVSGENTSGFMQTAGASLYQQVSNTSAITSNAFPSSNTTKFAGVNTSATNASVTLNTNGIAISVAGQVAQTQQPMYFSAGTNNSSANTLQFGDGNGVTFGLTNGSVTASVVAASGGANVTVDNWQPFVIATSSATSLPPGRLFFCPLNPQQNIAFSNIGVLTSHSFSSSAVATWGKTLNWSYGLYQNGVGTNSTIIEQIATSSLGMTLSASSNVSFGCTLGQGTNNATISSAAFSHSFINVASMKQLLLPMVTTLSAGGDYYYCQAMTFSTAGANVVSTQAQQFNAPAIGSTVGAIKMSPNGFTASNISNIQKPYGFMYAATVSALPTTVASSAFSYYSNYQPFLYLQG